MHLLFQILREMEEKTNNNEDNTRTWSEWITFLESNASHNNNLFIFIGSILIASSVTLTGLGLTINYIFFSNCNSSNNNLSCLFLNF